MPTLALVGQFGTEVANEQQGWPARIGQFGLEIAFSADVIVVGQFGTEVANEQQGWPARIGQFGLEIAYWESVLEVVQSDTKRQILEPVSWSSDTKRILGATDPTSSDTKRIVSVTEQSGGTVSDTQRIVSSTETPYGDTDRIIGPTVVSIPSDTNRRIEEPFSVDVDTRRDLVDAMGGGGGGGSGGGGGGGGGENPEEPDQGLQTLLGWIWLVTKTWPAPNILDLKIPPMYQTWDYAAPIDWYYYLVPTTLYYGTDTSDWQMVEPQDSENFWAISHLIALPTEVIHVGATIPVVTVSDTRREIASTESSQSDTLRSIGPLQVAVGSDTNRIIGPTPVGVGSDTLRAIDRLAVGVGSDTMRSVKASVGVGSDTFRDIIPGDLGFETLSILSDAGAMQITIPQVPYVF